MKPWVRALVAIPFLVWPLSAPAAPPGRRPASPTHALPGGAVARLGSPDWRLLAEPGGIVVSPDGKTLAVTTADQTVELLDADTGQRRLSQGQPASGRAVPVAFSPDGKRIAACVFSEKKGAPVLSIRDGAGRQELRRVEFRKKDRRDPPLPPEAERAPNRTIRSGEYVCTMAFSPDGKVLAAGVRYYLAAKWWEGGKKPTTLEMEENVVRLWDVSSGKQLAELTGHEKEIQGIRFSPDGRTLTAVGAGGAVRSWDTATGREKRPRWRAEGPLSCVAFSAGGKWLAGGSRQSIVVWETATGKVRHRLAAPAPEVRCLAFSRDGRLLAGAGGRVIRLWGTDGTYLRDSPAVPRPVTALAFSADGRRLFSGHQGERVVRCRDVATLRPSVELNGHAAPVRALGFTPDGKQILTSTLAGDYRLWDASGGKPSRAREDRVALETCWLGSTSRTRPLLGYEGVVYEFGSPLDRESFRPGRWPGLLDSSANGKRVLTLKTGPGRKPLLVVSDSRDNKVLREFAWGEPREVRAALSPDGRTVAAAAGAVVSFLDVASGKQRRYDFSARRNWEIFSTTFVKFSPDGTRVVADGGPATLRVVSVRDGRLLAELHEEIWNFVEGSGVGGVAFSPDGKTLAVAGCLAFDEARDGGFLESLSVWEVATGKRVWVKKGGNSLFAPDNRRVAVLRGDSIQVYDLYGGEVLREYKGPSGLVGNFAFSPDGRLLAASCRDTTALVWDTTSPARTAKPRPLDAERLASLWKDLEGDKSARAYRAMGRLLTDSEQTVSFLGGRLREGPPADAERLRHLIADLDHDQFARRDAASRELSKLGVTAAPALRAALARAGSAEARTRLRRLLRELQQRRKRLPTTHARAVQVLERIGTREAQRVLKSLADGPDDAPGTQDAREALQRIRKHRGPGP